MSLVGKTVWVVGGVGVVGRGITRGLLQAGATVIVNSRSEERLQALADSLDHPDRLRAYVGSLLPDKAVQTVNEALSKDEPLHHVIAHGAVRWWARPSSKSGPACDESYSLNITPTAKLLDQSPNEFMKNAVQLASLHFSAAQQLFPHLERQPSSSYTFVTGDGSGKPGGRRTSLGEINSHHVWGLSAALRQEETPINVREVRVSLPIHPSVKELQRDPLLENVSEYVGDLCAGMASQPGRNRSTLMELETIEDLQEMLDLYNVERVGSLPSYMCEQGYFTGSL